jgi:UDP-N-acetylglucosamine acyltransferase
VAPAANRIDPTARLVGDVDLGRGNVIGPGAVLVGPMSLGDDNVVFPYAVVGTIAEDAALGLDRHARSASGAPAPEAEVDAAAGVRIGDGNVLREFVTVGAGMMGPTALGSGCYLMGNSYVAHDCVLEDGVRFANGVRVGGFTVIGRGAYLGLGAVAHQFSVIGAYAMVGMNATVTRDVPPGSTVVGSPARVTRPNVKGLAAAGVEDVAWWDAMVAEDRDADVPATIAADIARYRAAVDAKADRIAAVATLRASFDGH